MLEGLYFGITALYLCHNDIYNYYSERLRDKGSSNFFGNKVNKLPKSIFGILFIRVLAGMALKILDNVRIRAQESPILVRT